MVLEECKAKIMALCKQCYVEQGWRPPLGVVYKKVPEPTRCKVDHRSARIWDADDLSNGDDSHSEGQPMGSWSPRESPLNVDGLPCESELISFNSFSSPSLILLIKFIPTRVLLFMLFWLPPFYQFTNFPIFFIFST